MAGLVCATLLADAGISVAIVDQSQPCLQWQSSPIDPRVCAINLASQDILEKCGVFQHLHPSTYGPLQRLIAWDLNQTITFDSAYIGKPYLGNIIENREIVRILWKKLQQHDHATLFPLAHPMAIMQTEDHIYLSLKHGLTLQAQCIVGADGGKSWLRQHMQIPSINYVSDHSALIAVIRTTDPHEQTGWQAFNQDSIFGLLPHRDRHDAVMIWSMPNKRAHQLLSMNSALFHAALQDAFGPRLGLLTAVTPPQLVPIPLHHAKQYTKKRMALIGDAAHTIHPLAGQGANLGLMDAAYLAACLITSHQQQRDMGQTRTTRQYERGRKAKNTEMSYITLGLKSCFMDASTLAMQTRNWGLQAINRCDLIKNYLMECAIGNTTELPNTDLR